ncbi:uncharacterized protein IAS62_004520 [Cryptococcus decagattii]|uniref:Uncharacterized protein n=1 Tax=Cryptococcus decagattii TaxID=1859122 RepID=A0ABZ2B364_9TREE
MFKAIVVNCCDSVSSTRTLSFSPFSARSDLRYYICHTNRFSFFSNSMLEYVVSPLTVHVRQTTPPPPCILSTFPLLKEDVGSAVTLFLHVSRYLSVVGTAMTQDQEINEQVCDEVRWRCPEPGCPSSDRMGDWLQEDIVLSRGAREGTWLLSQEDKPSLFHKCMEKKHLLQGLEGLKVARRF